MDPPGQLLDLVNGDDTELELKLPSDEDVSRIALAPERRRHLLLMVKEGLANVVRHAQARHVLVDLSLSGELLRLEIADDGLGFDMLGTHAGHGLTSLKSRAAQLGGKLDLRAAPGSGTRLVLEIRL